MSDLDVEIKTAKFNCTKERELVLNCYNARRYLPRFEVTDFLFSESNKRRQIRRWKVEDLLEKRLRQKQENSLRIAKKTVDQTERILELLKLFNPMLLKPHNGYTWKRISEAFNLDFSRHPEMPSKIAKFSKKEMDVSKIVEYAINDEQVNVEFAYIVKKIILWYNIKYDSSRKIIDDKSVAAELCLLKEDFTSLENKVEELSLQEFFSPPLEVAESEINSCEEIKVRVKDINFEKTFYLENKKEKKYEFIETTEIQESSKGIKRIIWFDQVMDSVVQQLVKAGNLVAIDYPSVGMYPISPMYTTTLSTGYTKGITKEDSKRIPMNTMIENFTNQVIDHILPEITFLFQIIKREETVEDLRRYSSYSDERIRQEYEQYWKK